MRPRYSSSRIAPETHPVYDRTSSLTISGSSLERTISEIMALPPGLSTRNISENTLLLLGARLITQLLITTSMVLSATGIVSMSPSRNSTLVMPSFFALSSAFSIMAGVISMPTTRPAGPTFFAAIIMSRPAPLPRSRTISPDCRLARATGFPHPAKESVREDGRLSTE